MQVEDKALTYNYKKNYFINTSSKTIRSETVIGILFMVSSIMVSFLLLCDLEKPSYYMFLFLLPLSFALFFFLFSNVYKSMLQNLGVLLIVILFYCRMVISPLFMFLGDYAGTITLNLQENTTWAILLVIYESCLVFLTMSQFITKSKTVIVDDKNESCVLRTRIGIVFTILLFAVSIVCILCIKKVPQILSSYRTIFNIGEEFFTNYEDSQVVEKYGSSFSDKLAIVIGQYLLRALIVLIPAYIIIWLSKKKRLFTSMVSFLICFTPMFFVGGAIAKSLIYIVCLLFLKNYMFDNKNMSKKVIQILLIGGITVIAWWLFKSSDGEFLHLFSKRFSAYFSGVNVVSGVFNLPEAINYKIDYFFLDYLGSIPFGHTIFGITVDDVQVFFNAYNSSSGQIPPTIAMGFYYFGPLLAPLYSVVFTHITIKAGYELNNKRFGNPFRCLRLILTVFYFSMGIVMYNVPITLTSFFTLLFPLFIMEKLAYRKENVS